MAAFHVFVDGSVDASLDGKERLAAAIAAHYGLPIADLRTRIATGRFRVKGNADRTTADMYVRDLTALGARCSVEEASSANVSKTPLPFPAVAPAPPAAARTASKNFQSGLSAAFSNTADSQMDGLGALDDGTVFRLSSVDGNDGTDAALPPVASFAPPAAATSAKPVVAKAKAASAEPLDMFAPPDAEDDNFLVNLAPEEEERAAKKRVSIPPSNVEIGNVLSPQSGTIKAAPASRQSRPSISAPIADRGPRRTGLADPKIRFAAGVIIAILVGFIPAHLVASMRENSAYAAVDAKVNEVQKDADAPDTYASLDAFRATQLENKREDRRNAALLAMLVWAAAGGGVAFVWFKKLAPRFAES